MKMELVNPLGLEPDAAIFVAGTSGCAEIEILPNIFSAATAVPVSPNCNSTTEDEQIGFATLKSLQESRKFIIPFCFFVENHFSFAKQKLWNQTTPESHDFVYEDDSVEGTNQ